jgi:hypothetical protein
LRSASHVSSLHRRVRSACAARPYELGCQIGGSATPKAPHFDYRTHPSLLRSRRASPEGRLPPLRSTGWQVVKTAGEAAPSMPSRQKAQPGYRECAKRTVVEDSRCLECLHFGHPAVRGLGGTRPKAQRERQLSYPGFDVVSRVAWLGACRAVLPARCTTRSTRRGSQVAPAPQAQGHGSDRSGSTRGHGL